MHMVSIFTAKSQHVRIVFKYRWIQHMGVYWYVSFFISLFVSMHSIHWNEMKSFSQFVEMSMSCPFFLLLFSIPTGYMLLYLTVLQILAHFCAHLVNTDTAAAIWLMIIILIWSSVGGYVVHIGELPSYLWDVMEYISPQRWLFPILIASEFSPETLANSASQTLCRSKQVSLLCLWFCHWLCKVLEFVFNELKW